MVKEGHDYFRQWAKYEQLCVLGTSVGYGGTVTAKIMDGKGEILPGAPKGSGPVKVHIDDTSMKVGAFVAKLKRREREFIKLYYLEDAYTVKEKAAMLRCGTHEIYQRLHAHQLQLVLYMEERKHE